MAKVRTEIELDEAILKRADELAHTQGRHRDAVIESALREELDDVTADDVLASVRARGEHSDGTVRALAEAQSSALRYSHQAARAAAGWTGTHTRQVDGDSGESGSLGGR